MRHMITHVQLQGNTVISILAEHVQVTLPLRCRADLADHHQSLPQPIVLQVATPK
jgi:hypothetical protein